MHVFAILHGVLQLFFVLLFISTERIELPSSSVNQRIEALYGNSSVISIDNTLQFR